MEKEDETEVLKEQYQSLFNDQLKERFFDFISGVEDDDMFLRLLQDVSWTVLVDFERPSKREADSSSPIMGQ